MGVGGAVGGGGVLGHGGVDVGGGVVGVGGAVEEVALSGLSLPPRVLEARRRRWAGVVRAWRSAWSQRAVKGKEVLQMRRREEVRPALSTKERNRPWFERLLV